MATSREELRRLAEARLTVDVEQLPRMSEEEVRKVVYDLQTHQIELELQNEELRRTQKEPLEARDRYSDLYDFAPVGYMTLSDKGLIIEANLTLADMLGVERRALFKKPLSAFVVPDDEDIYYLHCRQIVESKQRHVCQLRMLGSGAEPLWVEIDSIFIEGDEESDVWLRTVIHDITLRKQAQEDIQKAHDELETQVRNRTAQLDKTVAALVEEICATVRNDSGGWWRTLPLCSTHSRASEEVHTTHLLRSLSLHIQCPTFSRTRCSGTIPSIRMTSAVSTRPSGRWAMASRSPSNTVSRTQAVSGIGSAISPSAVANRTTVGPSKGWQRTLPNVRRRRMPAAPDGTQS